MQSDAARQPSQGGLPMIAFRLPRGDFDALQRLADARSLPLARMVRDHTAPLVSLAVDIQEAA